MAIASLVVSEALGILVPLALILWVLWQRRRYRASTDLSRAGNVIMHGVVEADAPPLTIDRRQWRYVAGASTAQRMDTKTVYDWNESTRRFHGIPFVLRTPDLRIQVEPGEDRFLLCWDPDQTIDVEKLSRTRRCTLAPGTSVEIFGAFEPAPAGGEPYRDGGVLPTLVPPRGDRLLVSKRPLAPKLVAMQRVLSRRAWGIAAAAAALHVALPPLWDADRYLLGIPDASGNLRAFVVTVLGITAIKLFHTRRPWNAGKLDERLIK